MKRSRAEMTRIHKEKCKELKKVRAKIAEDLGVELHQSECTYEGYCSGTCPKCMQEEMKLNAAIMKKQLEESDIKRRVAAAGLTTAAALCLTGCNAPGGTEQIDGDMLYLPETEEIAGGMAVLETEEVPELEGLMPELEVEVELAGEVMVEEECEAPDEPSAEEECGAPKVQETTQEE